MTLPQGNVSIITCKCALCLCHGHYTHSATVTTTLLKLYNAISQSIEGIILTNTHVCARIMTCATLTYNHITGNTLLTTEYLHTEPL